MMFYETKHTHGPMSITHHYTGKTYVVYINIQKVYYERWRLVKLKKKIFENIFMNSRQICSSNAGTSNFQQAVSEHNLKPLEQAFLLSSIFFMAFYVGSHSIVCLFSSRF